MAESLKKIPLLHDLALSTIMSNLGLSTEGKDIIYNMAIDEAGYNPEMVNKGNVLHALIDYGFGKNKDLADSLQTSLIDMFYGKDLGNISKEETLNMINRFDEKYDIYSDEAIPVIHKIINENLLNRSNLANLYQTKYKNIYKEE